GRLRRPRPAGGRRPVRSRRPGGGPLRRGPGGAAGGRRPPGGRAGGPRRAADPAGRPGRRRPGRPGGPGEPGGPGRRRVATSGVASSSVLAVALVCPDKFRGTLTAAGAAEALARGVEAAEAGRRLPLADGGEGTLDALLASQGGSRRRATVTGPLGDPVEAEWGLLPDRTAVVESARASGLALLDGPNDPLAATSRGT